MNLTDFLSGPVANALGWTLLHALWQGFALVLPTAVILHLLQNRSSDIRYRMGVLALLAQVLLSIATFAWSYEPAVTIVNIDNSPVMSVTLSMRWHALSQTLGHQPLPWHQQAKQFLQIHLSQFVFIYLIGVTLFGIRLAGGWVYLQRLSQTAAKPVDKRWASITNTLRSAMVIKAVVQVRESARIIVPMVVGTVKPVLLLPLGLATHLSIQEVEAVLAHELAHIKRHDYAVNLLQSLVEVLFFFHPALWWLSGRVREEREHCCDDLAVLVIGGDGRILAQALARVEEIRLTQSAPTPALAMAFASQRQHLLHRVHRMLGVPTRPFVSNSRLAVLTVSTVLLVGASVYAMQKHEEQHPQPKPRVAKSQSTRKHTAGNGTEFGITDNRKVDYVIWKGQKLPATRVAGLQGQLDQVMTGQLSLDRVKQPDRDILLTIIETNNSFDDGMNGLAAGLSQLDYNTIIKTSLDAANVAGTFPVNVDSVLKEVEKVNYNTLISDAMATVGQLNIAPDSLDPQQAYHERQMESLSRLLEQRSGQMQTLRLQMEKFRFPIEEIERNSEVLQWRKDKLMEQRDVLIEKHQRLLHNDGKQKLNQADVEKQLAALEPEIKKLESSLEELNKQVEVTKAKQEAARQPLEKLEKEAEQLEEQMDRLSDEIDKHSNRLAGSMSRNHNMNLKLNENLNINLNENLNRQRRQLDRQVRDMRLHMNRLEPLRGANRLAPPHPPRVPRPPKEPNPAQLNGIAAPPVAPVRPNVKVTPTAPTVRPTPAPVPRTTKNP
ncbi:MAG: hypothetical protein JWP57_964 [Spirosoma sp.]|nr:hypothetical protein [Spirosoma sp.]